MWRLVKRDDSRTGPRRVPRTRGAQAGKPTAGDEGDADAEEDDDDDENEDDTSLSDSDRLQHASFQPYRAVATHAFQARHAGELSFSAGERLAVLVDPQSSSGVCTHSLVDTQALTRGRGADTWLRARRRGESGLVPGNYLQLLGPLNGQTSAGSATAPPQPPSSLGGGNIGNDMTEAWSRAA
jgi:hypothetical protein